jgi:hypothetical protein
VAQRPPSLDVARDLQPDNPERQGAGWLTLDVPEPEVTSHNYLYDSRVRLGCQFPPGAPLSTLNRGTEYDFVRFGWDLYAGAGWTLAEIIDVLDASDQAWVGGCDTPGLNGCPAGQLPKDALDDTLQAGLQSGAFTQAQVGDWVVFAAYHGLDQ